MAIRKSVKLQADPTMTADHIQLIRVSDFSAIDSTLTVAYGIFSNAQRKAEKCPPFEIKKFQFGKGEYPFAAGKISNELIDQAILDSGHFGDGAELVADV